MVNLGKANGIEVMAAESKRSTEVYSEKKGWTRMYPNEINELASALALAQGEVEGAKKTANNPAFKGTKYANLEAVWDAIREPFTKHGLSIVQFPCESPHGYAGLRTVLMHKSGQAMEDRFFMPVKDPTNPQAYGSALTYARRYSLMAVAGIAPEDDDGNGAAKVDVEGIKAAFEAAFAEAEDVDGKKQVAISCKASALPPEVKTEILNRFGATIKLLVEQTKGLQGNTAARKLEHGYSV